MTAKTEFQAFLDAQKDAAYDFAGMTEEQQQVEMAEYTKLKIAVVQEQEKIDIFNAAKDVAFNALAEEADAARIALGQVWQTAEDNNYTVHK